MATCINVKVGWAVGGAAYRRVAAHAQQLAEKALKSFPEPPNPCDAAAGYPEHARKRCAVPLRASLSWHSPCWLLRRAVEVSSVGLPPQSVRVRSRRAVLRSAGLPALTTVPPSRGRAFAVRSSSRDVVTKQVGERRVAEEQGGQVGRGRAGSGAAAGTCHCRLPGLLPALSFAWPSCVHAVSCNAAFMIAAAGIPSRRRCRCWR